MFRILKGKESGAATAELIAATKAFLPLAPEEESAVDDNDLTPILLEAAARARVDSISIEYIHQGRFKNVSRADQGRILEILNQEVSSVSRSDFDQSEIIQRLQHRLQEVGGEESDPLGGRATSPGTRTLLRQRHTLSILVALTLIGVGITYHEQTVNVLRTAQQEELDRNNELQATLVQFQQLDQSQQRTIAETQNSNEGLRAEVQRLRRELADLKIRDEVNRIQNSGDYLPMPTSKGRPDASAGLRGLALYTVKNMSRYTIRVLVSGATDQELLIPAGGSRTLMLAPGEYRIAADVPGAPVWPYFGTDTLRPAVQYDVVFDTDPR
jgi:hypothetical protein